MLISVYSELPGIPELPYRLQLKKGWGWCRFACMMARSVQVKVQLLDGSSTDYNAGDVKVSCLVPRANCNI